MAETIHEISSPNLNNAAWITDRLSKTQTSHAIVITSRGNDQARAAYVHWICTGDAKTIHMIFKVKCVSIW